ncbi:hypothetical protein [Actinomadura montaniterrae]|uniref:Uncharacterized protein n=1 Tax=Actinomadura montaniterrae TaxID=1803903 RepID=A0A6L3VW52_9ACTN|nr:hypothetical protein [Actinomadura montaniterrae]KAB2380655.1 hypothetical protein F9B16_17275 [Actinomadura montaniterrae]KAB2386433.1 hypothetical protein F9B16_07110 [Actinomadura montaniterrae]
MTALLLVLAVLAALAGLGWLCLSPVRLGAAGAVLVAAHPAATIAVTAAVTAVLTVAAARMAYRSLREGGWCLVTVQRAAFAVSRAGGVTP